MILEELKRNNSDIILDEISWDEACQLANGAALFYVSFWASNKPREEKKVRWAGQVMTVGMTKEEELIFMRLTTSGHAVFSSMTRKEFEKSNSGILFHTRPFSSDDRRNLKPWNRWGESLET